MSYMRDVCQICAKEEDFTEAMDSAEAEDCIMEEVKEENNDLNIIQAFQDGIEDVNKEDKEIPTGIA